jgi:type I restriction enzyme M protein
MPRDDSIEDLENLPAPEVIAPEIIEELTAAFEEFAATRNPKNRPDG